MTTSLARWLDLDPPPWPPHPDAAAAARADACVRSAAGAAACLTVEALCWPALMLVSPNPLLALCLAVNATLAALAWLRYRRLAARVKEAKRGTLAA